MGSAAAMSPSRVASPPARMAHWRRVAGRAGSRRLFRAEHRVFGRHRGRAWPAVMWSCWTIWPCCRKARAAVARKYPFPWRHRIRPAKPRRGHSGLTRCRQSRQQHVRRVAGCGQARGTRHPERPERLSPDARMTLVKTVVVAAGGEDRAVFRQCQRRLRGHAVEHQAGDEFGGEMLGVGRTSRRCRQSAALPPARSAVVISAAMAVQDCGHRRAMRPPAPRRPRHGAGPGRWRRNFPWRLHVP